MTLETLAKDIAEAAETEAKNMIAAAKDEAKALVDEASTRVAEIESEAKQRAEKEAGQIAREVVASARQSNQKDVLVARRMVMDATYNTAKNTVADPGMKGRAAILKTLLAEAKKVGEGDFIVRPVAVDEAAIKKGAGDFKMGDSVDGLGGFILEAADGSVSFDMRFDNMLGRAWSDQLANINATLFE